MDGYNFAIVFGNIVTLAVSALMCATMGMMVGIAVLISMYVLYSTAERLLDYYGRKNGYTYKEASEARRMHQEASGDKQDEARPTCPGEAVTGEVTDRFHPLP